LDALAPTNWPEPSQISDATWALVEQRYASLGDLADAEIVTREDIHILAAKQGWSIVQAQRLLSRYRTGGMLGLARMKRINVLSHERKIPDLGSLSEKRRNELFRRHALLGELAEQERVSNVTLAARAEAVGVSLRTLREYHTRFRRDGLIGLATRPRIDKGKHHALSSHMTQVVESLRLTMRDATIRSVYERACEYAATIGEMAPSIHQVRAICAQIPAPVRLLADGREEEFRNRYRLTYPILHDPHRIIWQIDHKAPLHILVRDLRAPSHRSTSGEVRPFLTLVMDSASRLVMAGLFSYDHPNRFMVASAMRDAVLTCEQKPFGGVPDEIWVDNGKDLIAQHVYQLAQGLGVNLVAGPPHEPQVRGIVERFHETLDTRSTWYWLMKGIG
jgi:putative transposase